MYETLASGGIDLGFWVLPWSWVFWIAVVVIGMLLIRTAITLVKVAIIVGIGFVIYLGVEFLLNNFQ